MLIDTKVCTKCRVVKVLTEYNADKRRSDGKRSDCRVCESESHCKRREDNPERLNERSRKWNAANPGKRRESGRKSREKNPEGERERVRNWGVANPEKLRAFGLCRRSMKRALPSEWTAELEALVFVEFNGTCALTQLPDEIHVDHVIPLSWGHGGSYVGNMVPLSATLNTSKCNAHVYEWFEANRQRFGIDQSRFDRMISAVADQNGLTPEEYRLYYDWCRDNKRTVAQTKRDNIRYGRKVSSIELWRMATDSNEMAAAAS